MLDGFTALQHLEQRCGGFPGVELAQGIGDGVSDISRALAPIVFQDIDQGGDDLFFLFGKIGKALACDQGLLGIGAL